MTKVKSKSPPIRSIRWILMKTHSQRIWLNTVRPKTTKQKVLKSMLGSVLISRRWRLSYRLILSDHHEILLATSKIGSLKFLTMEIIGKLSALNRTAEKWITAALFIISLLKKVGFRGFVVLGIAALTGDIQAVMEMQLMLSLMLWNFSVK